MKSLQFEDKAVQKMYDNYMQRCKKTIKILSESDKEDCLLEINSYIYEYLNSNKMENEKQSLAEILTRLGEPEKMLKEVVASKKLAQAIKTFNPRYFIQALFLNVRKGTIYSVLSFLTTILFCLPILIVLKLIYPKNVGCFVGPNRFMLGFTSITGNANEVLGNWFFPVMLLLIVFFYFGVLFLLKSLKRTSLKYNLVRI